MNLNWFTLGLLAGFLRHFASVGKVNLSLIHSDELNIFSESTVDSLWGIYGFVWASNLIVTVLGVDMFCKHSVWISTNAFLGNPQTPAPFLRDDSDADDACDAVLRISLYHIPDSASLASSASFWFCVSRNITIFVSSSSKLQASFRYKCDGDDDGDGVCGIG